MLEVNPAADGPTNMAIDAALFELVRAGAPPILRLYRWDPPTLSFGRNQPAAGLYDADEASARGIAFVRRPTGGQAVLHADELTYAVIAPVDVIGRPRDAYRRINEALVAGLRSLGLAAELAGVPAGVAPTPPGHPPRHGVKEPRRGASAGGHPDAPSAEVLSPDVRSPTPDWTTACFRHPAAGEVVAGGRKLVGSAQRCEGRVILQHGSILLSGSQAAAEELLIDGRRNGRSEGRPGRPERRRESLTVDPGWTTLEEQLGRRPSSATLASAVADGFQEILGTPLAPAGLSINESGRARELRDTFASPDWTWRR